MLIEIKKRKMIFKRMILSTSKMISQS